MPQTTADIQGPETQRGGSSAAVAAILSRQGPVTVVVELLKMVLV